ncbi:MAG: hypothetical protein ACP6IP_01230 [Candidatus Njordarchaeia archaeon]
MLKCEIVKELFESLMTLTYKSQLNYEIIRDFSAFGGECLSHEIEKIVKGIKVEGIYAHIFESQIYFYLGKFEDAKRSLERGLSFIKSASLDPWTITRMMICVSSILHNLDMKEEAESVLGEALEYASKIPDKSDFSDALKYLALSHILMDNVDKGLDIIKQIPFQQRKNEAVLFSIEILCRQGRNSILDELIELLTGEWKIVAIAKIANCKLRNGEIDAAIKMANRVLSSLQLIQEREALVEVFKNILPIFIAEQPLHKIGSIISQFLEGNKEKIPLHRIIDVFSLKYLSDVKLLGLEIIIMEHLDKIKDAKDAIELTILLLVIDIITGKKIRDHLDKLIDMLIALDENLRLLYIQKLSNYLREIFSERILTCW